MTPSGDSILAAILIGAVIGAVIGAATSAITQKVTTGTIEWGQVGISALAGAVGGAAGGGIGSALAGFATGATSGTLSSTAITFGQTVTIGMFSSTGAGIGSRTIYNAAYNSGSSASNQLGFVFNPGAVMRDMAVGGIMGGMFYGLNAAVNYWGNRNAGSGYPTTRQALDADLINRGYTASPPSARGYVVYKHPNGARVTIRPNGEVIPTVRLPVDPLNTSWNAPMYNQRTFYDGTIISGGREGSHYTGHFVEPFK